MASTTTEILNTDDNITCEINDQQPRDDNSNICKSDPDVENVDNFQTPEESKSDQSSDKPGLHKSRDSNDQSTVEIKHQSDAGTDEETKSVHNGLDSSSGDNNNDDKDSVVPDEDTVDVFHSVSSDVVCSADSDKKKNVESSPTEHSTSESGISDEGLGTSQENMDMDKNSTESDTDSDNNGDEISPETENIVETVAETNSCVTASNEDENINSGSDEQPYINSNDIECIEDQKDNCSSDHVLSSPEDTTSSHETTESHHKTETPVQYEVEYTGTINLEQGCVENLDMVQNEDREVYADEKLATDELDSDNEVATKTESEGNVEVSCVIDTVKETEEVLHTEERNEVTCETNELVGDLRHDCNVEKNVTNSIQSTDELDTSVIKDNVEECDVKTCNDHLNGSDNKPEVDNSTNQSHIDTHPISDQGKDKAVKHEVKISTEEKRKSVESTDSKEKSAESDSDPLESTWRTCLLCFRDKMATIGLQSASLDTFVTSSSLTLRTMCTNHKTFRLKRQNTDPGDSRNGSEKRAIKIVKMSSFDTSLDPDSHAESDTKDNSAMDTMIIKESFQENTDSGDDAGSKSDSDNEAVSDAEATPGVETTEDYTDNKVTTEDKNTEDDSVPIFENDASESKAEPNVVNIVSEHKNSESVCEQISGIDDVVPKTETVAADDKAEDTATESNAELTTESATTLAILRDLGEKLNFEYEQRKRAEDWADFLSLELDAHIDARTSAEERFTAMRERTIRVVGKYRKLKSDHAALLSQLNDIALADAPPDQQAAPRSSLLRRNRSQGDRGAILAKRNAMLIRGSRRQRSSGDSESSDEKQADDAKTYNGVPRNLDDVKRKWEVDFKKKQQIEPKKLVASSSQDVSTSSVHDTSLSSTLNKSVDFSELSETTDHVKFSREMAAYDNYVTSTPIKTAESVDQLHALKQKSGDSVSKRVDFDKDKSKSTPDVRNEDDKDNKVIVNVKAFRNMWEQKIQKIPFQTMTNAQHEKEEQAANQETASSTSPKRMRIRNVEDLKKRMEETAKATEIERRLDKNDNVQISSDSEDDEFFDVDSPGEDFLSSGEVLTESLSPKQALHMWQNLSGSNNSSGNANEISKSASSHSQSQPKITLEAKASLEAQSVQPEASSLLDVPEIRLERSNRFSSLKSQWEQKGNKLPSENS